MHVLNTRPLEAEWERIEDGLPPVSTYLPQVSQAIDDSAADDDYAIDFDFERFLRDEPDAAMMREACASGELTAVQSVFQQNWLDQPGNERLDRDQFGASGLCEAIQKDDAVIAHYLLSNVVSKKQVHFGMATEYRAYSVLQLYIDHGWDINTYPGRMEPPALSLAIQDTKLTLWFLSHGANPNATCGLDITPLSIAIRDAPFEIVRILYDYGGSIEYGQLLHFAAVRSLPDRLDVVNYFLDRGAPINRVMYENRPDSYQQEELSGLGTPLHSAARKGDLDLVDLLLAKGADPSIKNSWGKLAVQEAEYYGWSEVTDRLRSLS